MAVLAVKTELKCKLCKHPEREQIDLLLEMRSNGQKDAAGVRVNADYVIERLREMGVENPNLDNLKIHWRKHCEVVKEETKETLTEQRDQAVEELIARAKEMTLDELMEWVARQGVHEAMLRELLEGKSGVTLDHAMKAVDTITRRKQENGQRKFFEALGGGIARALTGGQKALPEGEVIEAEPAEIEEVTA